MVDIRTLRGSWASAGCGAFAPCCQGSPPADSQPDTSQIRSFSTQIPRYRSRTDAILNRHWARTSARRCHVARFQSALLFLSPSPRAPWRRRSPNSARQNIHDSNLYINFAGSYLKNSWSSRPSDPAGAGRGRGERQSEGEEGGVITAFPMIR